MRLVYFTTALTFTLLAPPSFAGVSKVSSPRVTKGEAEIEYSGTRYGDNRSSLNNKQAHTYEAEYGLTDRWMLGIEAKSERESQRGSYFEGYGLETQYEMTTQGDWWLDSAIKAEYLHVIHGADEAEIKLLAARHYGTSSLTVNLGLERELGTNHGESLSVSSALQAKHAYSKAFAPGFEWHADYGKINDFGAEDTHYFGPIISGEVLEIGYTLGYYWGLNDASADNAMRVQIGLEF